MGGKFLLDAWLKHRMDYRINFLNQHVFLLIFSRNGNFRCMEKLNGWILLACFSCHPGREHVLDLLDRTASKNVDLLQRPVGILAKHRNRYRRLQMEKWIQVNWPSIKHWVQIITSSPKKHNQAIKSKWDVRLNGVCSECSENWYASKTFCALNKQTR